MAEVKQKSTTTLYVGTVTTAIIVVFLVSVIERIGELSGNFIVLLILKLSLATIIGLAMGWIMAMFYKQDDF